MYTLELQSNSFFLCNISSVCCSGVVSRNVTLHHLVWACLDALCTPRHGSTEKTITEVFQQLLPYIIMVPADGGGVLYPSIPSSVSSACQHSVTFVRLVTLNMQDALFVTN